MPQLGFPWRIKAHLPLIEEKSPSITVETTKEVDFMMVSCATVVAQPVSAYGQPVSHAYIYAPQTKVLFTKQYKGKSCTAETRVIPWLWQFALVNCTEQKQFGSYSALIFLFDWFGCNDLRWLALVPE